MFNYHFIDQWEGEAGFAKIDGKTFWTENYKWCEKLMPWFCKKYGIDVCGNDTPDRLSYQVAYTGHHNNAELKLNIGSNLNRNPCEVSWGIDDV
mmetsp:Transcript_6771/g.925  ORF Transcript_6771/g.925 Transcript_6771/m.925 type:complete len:94 (+) Transcript_6771:277-558(+)